VGRGTMERNAGDGPRVSSDAVGEPVDSVAQAGTGAEPEVETDLMGAFGRWLTRERELRGLDRDEVTRRTKVAPGVVEALESGDAGLMPPRAYVVGYLRSYAAVVGLDADDVVLRYEEAAGPEPVRRRRTGPGFTPERLAGIAAIVVAAAALLWFVMR
jgi:cytoskeletal protein RodZ